MGMNIRMVAVFSAVTLLLAANLTDTDPIAAGTVLAVTSELSHTPIKHAVSAYSYVDSGAKISFGLSCLNSYGQSLQSGSVYARKPHNRKLQTDADKDNSAATQCFQVLSAFQ